jgi:hypothetical protein
MRSSTSAAAPREAGPDGTLRLAFVRDDLGGHAGVVVRPRPGGGGAGSTPGAALELHGDVPDPDAVARQVARILCLDRDARPWAARAATTPSWRRRTRATRGCAPCSSALDGALEPERLRGLGAGQALEELRRLPGSASSTPAWSPSGPRGPRTSCPPSSPGAPVAARAAGTPALAHDEDAFRAAAEAWRPWWTGACVLPRVDAEASGRA